MGNNKMATSTVLLTNTAEMSYTGVEARGDGFYGYGDGLHTVSFHVNDFTGRIWLQATLTENPTEADWFNIALTVSKDYLQYDASSLTQGITFTGNFVYVRAYIDRTYLVDQNYVVSTHGVINKIVLMI
jgi:hypothetical protein